MEDLFKRTSISANFTNEDLELINEHYEILTGGTEEVSGRSFIMRAVEKAISKHVAKTVPDPEDKKTIESLQATIELQLKTIQDKETEIDNLTNSNHAASEAIEKLKNNPQIKEVEKQVPVEVERKLRENEIIVNCIPEEKELLLKTSDLETARMKKEVTPGQILLYLFKKYAINWNNRDEAFGGYGKHYAQIKEKYLKAHQVKQ